MSVLGFRRACARGCRKEKIGAKMACVNRAGHAVLALRNVWASVVSVREDAARLHQNYEVTGVIVCQNLTERSFI